MISVDQAVTRVAAAFKPLVPEPINIGHAAGRVLAEDATARLTQPPAPVSAMDGYAVRTADVATVPVSLKVIGSAPAGHPFGGTVGKDEAVRIFTGGVVPKGSNTIVIQEDTDAGGDTVLVKEAPRPGRHIRVAGLDFKQGDILLSAGHRLTARDVALLAAADIPQVAVRRKPRVVIAATGDELFRPGEAHKPGGIVASSVYGLCALVEKWGGIPQDIGILPDRADSIAGITQHARDADVIVTLGGASVGDHDLVQTALGPKGFVLGFWKIAMRPGKPLIFGHLDGTPLLGLPGNPVSSYVCALLFLKPAIAAMLGETIEPNLSAYPLATDLPANDSRQDYIRARLVQTGGQTLVEPLPVQDSSMQRALAEADTLIVRAPHAPAARMGDKVRVILLD